MTEDLWVQVARNFRVDGLLCLVDVMHIEQHLDEVRPEGTVNEAVQQVCGCGCEGTVKEASVCRASRVGGVAIQSSDEACCVAAGRRWPSRTESSSTRCGGDDALPCCSVLAATI